MAEAPPFSSQTSQYEQHQIMPDQENLLSSPLAPPSIAAARMSSLKPKKLPSVTPKRFTKFFTPRGIRGGRPSKAGRQLRDITKNGANRRRTTQLLDKGVFMGVESDGLAERPTKRRKHSVDIASSPPQSSPLKHVQTAEQFKVFEDVPPLSPAFSDDESISDLLDDMQPFAQPIRRLRPAGRSRRILERSFGGYDALTSGRRGAEHGVDWRSQTANFVSTSTDSHHFGRGRVLPFCTASCNTNSLIAVGEEEGTVRIIDTSPAADFTNTHVSFRPHHNAIMDLAFSSDDYRLATASGDQGSRIVDMQTQKTICILSGHKSTVKQVRFQPNDDNMITSCSRDGSVLIWDMRCGGTGSVASLSTHWARKVPYGDAEPAVQYAKHILEVGASHRSTKGSMRSLSGENLDGSGVSITAIQHLPHGREHLLLTTSEISCSIKLWDLRNVGRRASNALLSSTVEPAHHRKTRNYGISAMTLSGDGGRIYTLCRDGVVYAHSTNHVILGCAPEMSSSSGKPRNLKVPKSGNGPMYGFRHPSLRLATFFVKAALRPTKTDKSEMLAVGSSENCAVLFPTDERHLPARERSSHNTDEDDGVDVELPSLSLKSIQMSKAGHQPNDIPIYEHGTALVRGHSKEVSSLAWSDDGDLVTVSDDFRVRCWRENVDDARELRNCGEGGGKRWGCGWADVGTAWDEDE